MLSSVVKPLLTITGVVAGGVSGVGLAGMPEFQEGLAETLEPIEQEIEVRDNTAPLSETMDAIAEHQPEAQRQLQSYMLPGSENMALVDGAEAPELPELTDETKKALTPEQVNTYEVLRQDMPDAIAANKEELTEAIEADMPGRHVGMAAGGIGGGAVGYGLGSWVERIGQQPTTPAYGRG